MQIEYKKVLDYLSKSLNSRLDHPDDCGRASQLFYALIKQGIRLPAHGNPVFDYLTEPDSSSEDFARGVQNIYWALAALDEDPISNLSAILK